MQVTDTDTDRDHEEHEQLPCVLCHMCAVIMTHIETMTAYTDKTAN